MNYGDGWYGGVYIGAMYSLAFISDDINIVVQEALKTIPENSRFHQCMNDVIQWHRQYPNDWKQTWAECEKKWNQDIGCPEGTLLPYNIDAVINCAYVVMGLLYGEGDFYKTMDISTRCGQDSDCNPASAAGILATIQGYSQIPEYWMKNLREVENLNFAYTDMSLNQTYQTSFKHALQMIKRNGGSISGDNITIVCQTPVPVRFEQAFEGMFPIGRQEIRKELRHLGSFTFEGTGIVFTGYIRGAKNYVAQVEMYVDGKIIERAVLPTGKNHRVDLFWKYQLPEGKHIVTFKWLNPDSNAQIHCNDALIYSNRPLPIPTDMSLNQTYQTSFKHALQMIKRNGGSISGDNITIVCQTPVPVRFEQAFEGMFPIGRQEIRKELRHLGSFTFEGTGIVFTGYIRGAKNYVAQVEMYVDGKIIERAVLPTGKNHRVDLFWKYQLPEGKHIVTFKWLNPDSNAQIHCNDALIYSNRPLPIPHQ